MKRPLGTVDILTADRPMLRFAGAEIEAAVKEKGYRVRCRTSDGARRGADHLIRLGVVDEIGEEATALWRGRRGASDPGREGFAIQRRQEDGGLRVLVAGGDERGAMYGGLEVAEAVALGAGLDAIGDKRRAPHLEVRGFRYNLPLPSGYTHWDLSPEEEKSEAAWFYDLAYWECFLDMLARNRYNMLTLWHDHPFDRLVKVEKYPEAVSLGDRQLERNRRFFRRVLTLARDRGIDTFLISWNIHVSEPFARAHGCGLWYDQSPLVRDYMFESVKALLRTYPELTGIGTCAGEAMRKPTMEPANNRWNQRWVRDTYIRAIKEERGPIPLIYRNWCSLPEYMQKYIAADYGGPIYLDIKFNGEHMYSLPTPHLYRREWIEQKPRDYKLLWHLRNDCIHLLRWGDPEFVRQTVESCHTDYSVGFFQGDEGRPPGVDIYHRVKTPWTYDFEKNWLRFALWGRLGYDPKTPDSVWKGHFDGRYGTGAGRHVYRATVAGSKVIPTITAFHWNYMNGDWDPESCDGSWNTSRNFRINRGVRHPRKFHTVVEFVFNQTQESSWLTIPQYVNAVVAGKEIPASKKTPLQVARLLEREARACLRAAARARDTVTSRKHEYRFVDLDFSATAALGRYYGAKIRAATELMMFLRTGLRRHQNASIKHLERAVEHWDAIVAHTKHYKGPVFDRRGVTHDWAGYADEVRYDIEMVRQMGDIEAPIH